MARHDIILDQANEVMLEAASRKAGEETIWALDIGDTVLPLFASIFDKMSQGVIEMDFT